MTIAQFVLLTLQSFVGHLNVDAKADRAPTVQCQEIKKTRSDQSAGCTYTTARGERVTVIVRVEREEI